MQAYDFPGNVRELKNALEHAFILAKGEEVRPEDLPRSIRDAKPKKHTAREPQRTLAQMREGWLAPLERKWLTELLEACGGSVQEAARRADVNRVTLYRLLQKHGIALKRVVV